MSKLRVAKAKCAKTNVAKTKFSQEELVEGGTQAIPHHAIGDDHHLCLLNTYHSRIGW
jgi:hypothetical protein